PPALRRRVAAETRLCARSFALAPPHPIITSSGSGKRGHALSTCKAEVMDQRYVDTVRACKVILRNMDHLDDSITDGQRVEIRRLLFKVYDRMTLFLEGEEPEDDDGFADEE